ncbi:MAG: flagellar filament outer layer protein FlaA [Spirochaetota bacterium]|nr:flagellar filament outer layer protein FlaA [Spirochaetota bacterium]
MRKAIILSGILLLLLSTLLITLAFAQTTTEPGRLLANRAFILDFGQYPKRMQAQIEKTNKQMEERNKQVPSRGLPSENFQMKYEDWAPDKWSVQLNSSAAHILNNVLSYATNYPSLYWQNNHKQLYNGQKIAGFDEAATSDVLAIRIHFPNNRQNCWAKIMPPFEFNAYDELGEVANEFNGVINNVGQIQSVSVWVKGRNYDFGFAARLKDRDGIEREYFFGSLLFDNWRELTWINPNYIENPRDRVLERLPLYPIHPPYIRFTSFVVYRQMDAFGGDFVMYIRDLKMAFDKAIPDEDEDIDDEKVWGILAKARSEEKEREIQKLAEKRYLLEQEQAKLQRARDTGAP